MKNVHQSNEVTAKTYLYLYWKEVHVAMFTVKLIWDVRMELNLTSETHFHIAVGFEKPAEFYISSEHQNVVQYIDNLRFYKNTICFSILSYSNFKITYVLCVLIIKCCCMSESESYENQNIWHTMRMCMR